MKITRRTPGPFEGGESQQAPEKLYFLQDLLMGSRTVYSGHSGIGKKFIMHQSDYGKYVMKPSTLTECELLKAKIEKSARGQAKFNWNIIPITDINLCNFYGPDEQEAFEELQKEQKNII